MNKNIQGDFRICISVALNGDLFFENAIFEGLVAGLAVFSSIN